MKALGYDAGAGGIRLKLAREFGFCYGVDRAVDYAYQTRSRFPDRDVFLTGEIIHNPDVNARLREMGIRILGDSKDPGAHYAGVGAGDVVILPAFGVPVQDMAFLQARGCVLVDTTCGSVLNVWKKVHLYAREGFTAVIHGKHYHEETRATASQALTYPRGRYLCVRDIPEAELVAAFIRGAVGAADICARFAEASSPGFDPATDLERIGLANQTTMLMSETLAVQEILRRAMADRHGEAGCAERFRAFDTICSATQERQDAVLRHAGCRRTRPDDRHRRLQQQQYAGAGAHVRAARPDVLHRRSAVPRRRGPSVIAPSAARARFAPTDGCRPNASRVGLTAGASTPDSVVGDVVERILAMRGCTSADLRASPRAEAP